VVGVVYTNHVVRNNSIGRARVMARVEIYNIEDVDKECVFDD
jgi:hypothetical protein